MNVNEARELLKAAAGVTKTYPISRFLTSPKAIGLTFGGATAAALGAIGLATGAPAALAAAPVVAALYGGIGYGAARLGRFIKSRALLSRVTRNDPHLMKSELATLKAIKTSSAKSASKILHPISEALTSRAFNSAWGAAHGIVDLAMGNPAGAALGGAAAAVNPAIEAAHRVVYSRALRARVAMGGKALTGTERQIVDLVKGRANAHLAKRLAGGAAIAGGAAAAGYGVKKLVEQDATA
jgi:hypothetical protein